MSYNGKIAQLIEIRRSDGAQKYVVEPYGTLDVLWLCGVDRCRGARVGDKGTMHYVSDARRGRYVFSPPDAVAL